MSEFMGDMSGGGDFTDQQEMAAWFGLPPGWEAEMVPEGPRAGTVLFARPLPASAEPISDELAQEVWEWLEAHGHEVGGVGIARHDERGGQAPTRSELVLVPPLPDNFQQDWEITRLADELIGERVG